MLTGALIFLVNVALGLFTVALLLRFYLQWAQAPYRNPLSQFVQALTDFAVRPARRIIPGLRGLDLATLALAWLAQFLQLLIVLQFRDYPLAPQTGLVFAALVLMAAVAAARLGIYIVMVAVLVQAVLTWVSPYSPVMPLLNSLTRPFLRVFQRRIPPVGNVDLSPLFVLVAGQLLLMVPLAYLEAVAARML